jgi:hypothetical protein
MLQKKILVPLGNNDSDLKCIHYALSLAERLQAQVFVLQRKRTGKPGHATDIWRDEALSDLINSARRSGIFVSCHIAEGTLKQGMLDLAKEEHIHVLVFGENDGVDDTLLNRLKPLVTSQIIQVRGKNYINYL